MKRENELLKKEVGELRMQGFNKENKVIEVKRKEEDSWATIARKSKSCWCSPSETYGRKWGDSNFQILTELPVQPQAAGVVGTFLMCFIYIDGEIPKTSNSTFGNCSGEGKNCPILLIHY